MISPESLLTWLAAATVRGSLLIAAVLLLQVALRPWMTARWRMALWLPVVFVLFVPFLPQCGWSLEGSWRPLKIDSEWCCPTVALPWDHAGQHEGSSAGPWHRAENFGWWVIALCWAAGASWFFGVVVWSYVRMVRGLRRGAVQASGEVGELLATAAEVIGVRRMPEVLISEKVSSPAVTGLFRPTLLLPTDFPGVLTAHEARLVLQHELLHLRRFDLWGTWLLCLLQAVHWFNPVVWLAFNRIRIDCEQACDEGVLDRGSDEDVTPYGHALIKVGSCADGSNAQLGILSVASSTAALRRRLHGVAAYRRVPPAWSLVWLLLIGTMAVLGATRSPELRPGDLSPLAGQPECGLDRSRQIILPVVQLHDATIEEAVEYLQEQARAADDTGLGVKILLTPEGERSSRHAKVTLNLRQVSVWEAFVAMTGQANLGLDGNAYLLCLKWPFATRSWPLDANDVSALGNDPRAVLSKAGVAFPPGASLHLVPGEGYQLWVRNSQENLQRIDTFLHRSPPRAP